MVTASGGDYRLVVVARRARTARTPRSTGHASQRRHSPLRLVQYRLATIRPQMSERSFSAHGGGHSASRSSTFAGRNSASHNSDSLYELVVRRCAGDDLRRVARSRMHMRLDCAEYCASGFFSTSLPVFVFAARGP